jgi:tetratricopeptide (TPR) repeat protein
VAAIVGNLAVAERELGNYERAIEFHRRDLELSTRTLGPDHPAVGTIWINLARATQRTGDYTAALVQAEKALAIFRQHFKPQHALILTSENSRALYLARLGRTEEARMLLGSILELRPESNEGIVALLTSRLQLADIDRWADRFGPALALTQRVLDDPVAARDPKLIADAHWARACALAGQQAGDEADRARRNALQVQESDPQATAQGRLYAQARYAGCASDREGALQLLRAAVANGFKDPAVLVEPAFVAVRELPAFAAIARAVTFSSSTGSGSSAQAAASAKH